MVNKRKNTGGRPPLGINKRKQHSITFSLLNDGFVTKVTRHKKVSRSNVVEEALNKFRVTYNRKGTH